MVESPALEITVIIIAVLGGLAAWAIGAMIARQARHRREEVHNTLLGVVMPNWEARQEEFNKGKDSSE